MVPTYEHPDRKGGSIQRGGIVVAGFTMLIGATFYVNAHFDRGTGVAVARIPLAVTQRFRLPTVAEAVPTAAVVATPGIAASVEASADNATTDTAQVVARSPSSAGAGGTHPPRRIVLGEGEYLPLSFDLGSPGKGDERVGGGETIVTSKKLRSAGRDIGSMPIHVDSGSRLLVDRADLVRALTASGIVGAAGKVAGKTGLVSFAELRSEGIDLRYEPNSDAIMLAVR